VRCFDVERKINAKDAKGAKDAKDAI